jgi:hypothetical protein
MFSDSNYMSMQDDKEDEEERSKPEYHLPLRNQPENIGH